MKPSPSRPPLLQRLFSSRPHIKQHQTGLSSGWRGSVTRFVRLNYLRIIRLKTSAHSIALGAALGILIGCMPIIPFQTIVVLTLAVLFRANKIAAFSFTFISSPLNIIPFYAMLYMVGSKVMPFFKVRFDPRNLELMAMIEQGWRLVAVMTVGGLILGIPSSVLTYFVIRKLVLTYRKRKAIRLLKKHTDA